MSIDKLERPPIGVVDEFPGMDGQWFLGLWSYLQNLYAGVGPYVDVRSFGATGEGVKDDTEAIQATIDYAYENKKTVIVSGGTYLITKIKIYPGTVIQFCPESVLKLTSGATFGIRMSESPTVEIPTAACERAVLINPQIDMNGNGNVGLFLEAAQNCSVYDLYITGLPASGTFEYNDGAGANTYQKAGLYIKGITGISVGAYYNVINHCYIRRSTASVGACGIVLTTTTSASAYKANFNCLIQPRTRWCTKGIYIERGDDNTIINPEVTACTTGIDDDSIKNTFIKPYMEDCTTGLDESGATDQLVLGIGGIADTTAIATNTGTRNSWFSGRGGLRVIYAPTGTNEFTGADIDRVNSINSFSHMEFKTKDAAGDLVDRINFSSGVDWSRFDLDDNSTVTKKVRLRIGRRASDGYSLETAVAAAADYSGDIVWVAPTAQGTIAQSAVMYCHLDYLDATPVYRWVPLVQPGTHVYHNIANARAEQTGGVWTDKGTGGARVVNLPAAERGLRFTFLSIDGNQVRAEPNGSEVIRGGGAGKYAYIDAAGECFTLIGTGDTTTHWEIMSTNGCTVHFEA